MFCLVPSAVKLSQQNYGVIYFFLSQPNFANLHFWLEFLFFAKGNNNVKKSHLFSNIYVTQREVTHISI